VKAKAVLAASLSVALVAVTYSIAAAHDLFVKPATFFVAENGEALVRVLNGTFSRSENSIARARIQDLSIISPAGRTRMDTSSWSDAGDTSTFRFKAGGAGTYVLGVSTRANVIAMSADTFHLYLAEDGIPDELQRRRKEGASKARVKERYHKHVKAFVQVGQARTDSYAAELGYPAELVPASNPYSLRAGQTLRVKTLVDGKPVANQYVLYGGRTLNDRRIEQRSVRSDANGIAMIRVPRRGTWYVKFIHMARLSGDPAAEYESKWATMTFQVR
jgi:uncharacterized GH25 family protein